MVRHMRLVAPFSVIVASIASALVLSPVPARASDATPTISAEPQHAIPGACHNYLLQYDLNLPAEAISSYWTGNLSAENNSDVATVGLGSGDATVGVRSINLCVEDADDLLVNLSIEVTYDAGAGYTHASSTGQLHLKPAVTRTELRVSTTSPRFNQPVRFSVLTEARGTDGVYYKYPWAEADLQVLYRSRWVSGKGFEFTTGANGKDSVTWRWNTRKTITFRLVTPAQSQLARRSVSKTITVRPRG